MPVAQAERALRVRDGDRLVAALDVLAQLSAQRALEYEPVVDEEEGTYAIVVPAWAYDTVARALANNHIRYEEMRVQSAADVPPHERAQRRGWMPK